MKHLRHWRKQAGLTQEELAKAVEVTTMTVFRWESDIREPRVPEIKKLCSVLNVTEAELLNGPIEGKWELVILFKEPDAKEVADLTDPMGSLVCAIGDSGISIKMVGPTDLWKDNTKFEELVERLRKKRAKLLKFNDEDD